MDSLTVEIPIPTTAILDCERCAERLRTALAQIRGVQAVRTGADNGSLAIDYDPNIASVDSIKEKAREIGIEIDERYAHATVTIAGLECPDCGKKIENAVRQLPGILYVSANYAAGSAHIEYDSKLISLDRAIDRIRTLGYGVARGDGLIDVTLKVGGMDCGDCARKIDAALARTSGVESAEADFMRGEVHVTLSGSSLEAAIQTIEGFGYTVERQGHMAAHERGMPMWTRFARPALTGAAIVALAVAFVLHLLGLSYTYIYIALAAATVLGGVPVAKSAWGSLRARTVDINLLMTIAVIGAAVIGEWAEAASVVVLFAIANLLESYTVERTRRSIRALAKSAPTHATVSRNGVQEQVPVDAIALGDRVIVRPGEHAPIDGIVTAGSSSVDESSITGEPIPVTKEVGSTVYAGALNGRGALEIQTTRLAAESTLARIIALVQEAQSQRAPSQQFIDRFARYYTPAVILLAIGVAVLPPLALGLLWHEWVYRGLAMLIVACPCALVIATPVSVVSALSNAARSGILIKGGVFLEAMSKVRQFALDKTGTLTMGRPRVNSIHTTGVLSEDRVLAIAAAIESWSEHPLADAIVSAARERGIAIHPADEFSSAPGQGASAVVDGVRYRVGAMRMFEGEQIDAAMKTIADSAREQGKSIIVIADDAQTVGLIVAADEVRSESRAAIEDLRRAGISRITMLSGDNERAVRHTADALGIDDVRGGLLPEDKVSAVREMIRSGGDTAMVGDGVNDAPALAASSVGIAMGVAGSGAALDVCDVALMSDDLGKLPYLVHLSARAATTIRVNVAFAVIVKVALLGLVIPGELTLWLAVLGDMGTSMIVIANAMRLLRGPSRQTTMESF